MDYKTQLIMRVEIFYQEQRNHGFVELSCSFFFFLILIRRLTTCTNTYTLYQQLHKICGSHIFHVREFVQLLVQVLSVSVFSLLLDKYLIL